MRPGEYTAQGDATGGGWLVGTRIVEGNPRRLLRPSDQQMVRLWLACRPGGLGGARLLPESGGVLDQVGTMLDALSIMDDEAHRWTARREGRSG